MTSQLAYKPQMSSEEAVAEIRRNMGIQFDPEIAGVFVDHVVLEFAKSENAVNE